MSIPDFQSCMLPLLQFASEADECSVSEAYEALASYFQLTKEEMNELILELGGPGRRAGS